MKKLTVWIDGYKTYLVALLVLVLATLCYVDVLTPDKIKAWAHLVAVMMYLVALGMASFRSALKKLETPKVTISQK